MTSIDIPALGTLLLGFVLVSAGFTFAVSVAAGRGRPHLLRSARFGTLATIAMVACAVFLLAYAFQAHDFRIRYVARYSDRSMPEVYLWTALWGGQDGSLLWWTFLSGLYIVGFTWWVRDKYRALQPAMFATLMSVLAFFVVLQLFAANPFQTSFGGVPADGEGLNPLLQNYWMAIHPPALYLGLTGWAVPFAFVVAALITGRLDDEWIHGARKWVLLAWGFLSLGNLLGMFWSYEELGWGGYWAWDPVENASFLPWLSGTAYVHSVMIQERRGTFRVWNVFLLCLTFILTIFGTFLTRSGLIASVHSFARSDIGVYFAGYLIVLCAFVFLLIAWRLPDLRAGRRVGGVEWVMGAVFGLLAGVFLVAADVAVTIYSRLGVALCGVGFVGLLKLVEWLRLDVLRVPPQSHHERPGFESLLSREFAFLVNNWILLGMAVFVLLATTFPLISEALRGETVTVGPDYYNYWMVPLGLMLLFLTGAGPLIAWRKATGANLLRALRWPLVVGATVGATHLAFGSTVGYPPWVEPTEPYETITGQVLGALYGVMPLISSALCSFVLAAIFQEFYRGVALRRKNKGENPLVALFELVARARRRYGGYTVHIGIVLLFFGFTGAAYDVEEEASLFPGETMEVGDYTFRYERVVMDEDPNKRMIFTDLTVLADGQPVAEVRPAKFVYRSHPEMPTTEVAIHTTMLHNLYVIMSTVDPQSHRGTFRVIKQPLVIWIWIGGALLLVGVAIAIFPRMRDLFEPADGLVRRPARASAATTLLLLVLGGGAAWALAPPGVVSAQADSSSTLHAGTVVIRDPEERRLFSRLLCECGDCQRLPLHTCGCGWAEGMRAELRARMERGDEVNTIIEDYRSRFGPSAISIPSDEGLDRALWAVPIAGIVLAAGGLLLWGRRWTKTGAAETSQAAGDEEDSSGEYDDRLEQELRDLEGE